MFTFANTMNMRPNNWFKAISERSTTTKIALLLGLAALVSCIATYAALNAAPPFGDNPQAVFWLINLDLVILVLLVGLIAKRIAKVWSNKKEGIAGSNLHVRLIAIFSILVATPAIFMTIFSAVFFHYGIQTWFSDRVQTAVLNSQAVAEAYLDENRQSIRGDSLLLAQDITVNANILINNKAAFIEFLENQAFLRNFSEVVVFEGNRRIIGTAGFTFALSFENVINRLPDNALDMARNGDVYLTTGANEDRVRAVLKLQNFQDTFIFVGRIIDPDVLVNLENTRSAAEDYASLQGQYAGLQITVTMIFLVVGVMLLLAAIWFGIVLARQLVSPISTLISTADRVSAGDLTARVPEQEKIEEFEFLGKSFNRMTSQIADQRDELINANRQMDERRRFTEAVLAGVSSGIIGIDENHHITIANVSAVSLFETDEETNLIGQNIVEIMPELSDVIAKAHEKPNKIKQAEITYKTQSGSKRIFLVRIAIERIGDVDKGAVITFDDITELQSAQRKAAWSDVARRIAHEIKNPLTPIQLSAERLKRKYLKEVQTSPEVFEQCTDTIVKHVEDIGRMVNEFSSFARMPEPKMRKGNLKTHILEVLALQQQANPNITFTHDGLDANNPMPDIVYDPQQIRQVLVNLILNAADSVQETDSSKGHIHITLNNLKDETSAAIIISDNGVGFPEEEDVDQLTEPYITHKEKGTGLGLAIVKKIMEDHEGRLILGQGEKMKPFGSFQDLGGANACLVLPLSTPETIEKAA